MLFQAISTVKIGIKYSIVCNTGRCPFLARSGTVIESGNLREMIRQRLDQLPNVLTYAGTVFDHSLIL